MQEIPAVQQPTQTPPPMYPPPTYQPPQKPPRSRKGLWLIIGILAAILLVVGGIIGGIAGTQGQKTSTPSVIQPTQQATTQPTPTQAPTETPQPTPTAPTHYTIGQTGQVGTDRQGDIWEITLTSAKTDGSESYLKPGNVFLNILVRVKNISTTEQHISDFNFELRDLEGQRQEVSYDPNAEPSLGGAVEAGSPLKGTLTYEVPSSVHQFELFFTMIGVSGQIIWDIRV
jgi:uncharacterized protein DUF4352